MSPRVLIAPDKFKGTATAIDVVEIVGNVAKSLGWDSDGAPMADGGEGTLDVVGGAEKITEVTGPLGARVPAKWKLTAGHALIEMSAASGLQLVGGAEGNDPMAATTRGTGELIAAAMVAGAKRISVGLGGSATTDGGLGAVEALRPHSRLKPIELTALVDVSTRFTDAAKVFGPQKGASKAQVAFLERRLSQLQGRYEEEFGVDVSVMPGAGAAGGLGGGLAAIGFDLVPGFEFLAETVGLGARIEAADLVITGEGRFDSTSLDGKVAGGVVDLAVVAGVPVVVLAGDVDVDPKQIPQSAEVVSLSSRFGKERSWADLQGCLVEAAEMVLSRHKPQ
jgi:glycerate 2-kinase